MNDLSAIARAPSRMGTGYGFAVMLIGMLCVMTPFVSGVAVNTLVAVLILAAGLTITTYAFKAGQFSQGFVQFLFGGITLLAGAFMLVRPMLGHVHDDGRADRVVCRRRRFRTDHGLQRQR